MPIYSVYPMIGFDFILLIFVICVLGGLGSVPGAILGSIIIALIETFSGFLLGESMKQIIYFIIFITILVVRPTGLLGKKEELFRTE
jgi:branched-chain amino acid transport system permease protein